MPFGIGILMIPLPLSVDIRNGHLSVKCVRNGSMQ